MMTSLSASQRASAPSWPRAVSAAPGPALSSVWMLSVRLA